MTANEASKVAKSLATFAARAKADPANDDRSIWRIHLPMHGRDSMPFRAYIYHPISNRRKIIIGDGGSMVAGIRQLGTPNIRAIQKMLSSFGLKLMEDMTVMEDSNRPMSERMMSYLQAWCAVDGMFRIWDITKEETQNALRPSIRHSSVDESVQPDPS